MKQSNVSIPVDYIGYFRSQQTIRPGEAKVAFFMQPDALVPLYQIANNASREEAANWAKNHASIRQLKTSNYLTKEETLEALGLGTLSKENEKFNQLWDRIVKGFQQGSGVSPGASKQVRITVDGRKQDTLEVAKKMTVQDGREHVCIEHNALDMLSYILDMGSDYTPPERPTGRKK